MNKENKEENTDNSFQFDKRVIHRFVQKGKISKSNFEKHLTGLIDLEDKSENITTKNYVEKKGNIDR